MNKKNIWKKIPVFAIIGLLIFISATGSAGIIDNNKNNYAGKNHNMETLQGNNGPTYTLLGTKVNDWYISCVTIQFFWNPYICKEVWLNIAGSGWQKYNNPVETCLDGRVTVTWKWVDMEDNEHLDVFQIKIDKSPPTIELEREITSETTMTFTANVDDGSGSGIDYVEFYEDDKFRIDIHEEPYAYDWQGSGVHIIRAIAYDIAEHTASAEADTERSRSRIYVFKTIILSKPLQELLNIFAWGRNIFSKLI